MSGPCLCGDPYCARCFPGQARTLAADEAWAEHADALSLVPGTATYERHRRAWWADLEAAEERDEALMDEYAAYLESTCPTCLRRMMDHDPECSRGGDR